MADILLATVNAKYIHSSLGLRYLYANLGDLQKRSQILEFTIEQRAVDIVETLLSSRPVIIGFGVYIWNADITAEIVSLLKRIRPEITVILGGPEVSYEQEQQPLTRDADFVISGMGDLEFPSLCRRILSGEPTPLKLISAKEFELSTLEPPYRYYSQEDIEQRLIYVEASRGCPYKCEFCLSALDKTAWPFDLDRFLDEMDALYQRGARHFRFVDRTFNLKTSTTTAVLEFFRKRLDNDLFLHFELIPDRLPEAIKRILPDFPAGSLQFEIGVQTFTEEVQALISRRQDNPATRKNIQWLRTHTRAHLHADLIFGLPGEDLASFADSFDSLVALDPQEIQLGILKRLRGSPIVRHTEAFDLRFNPKAPYNILSTDRIDFETMQRVNRFARYWDMIANSGRFKHTRLLLTGNRPFENFLQLSDWLFRTSQRTHRIALTRLFDLVETGAVDALGIDPGLVSRTLNRDRAEWERAHRDSRVPASKPQTPHRKRQVRHLRLV